MKRFILLIIITVSAAAFCGCGSLGNIKPNSFASQVTVTNLDGTVKNMSDFKGKVVFFTVWTTWCGHCHTELEGFKTLQEKYKDKDFIIVAASDDNAENVNTFLKDKNYPYYFCLADRASLTKSGYEVRAYPSLFIIDKSGNSAACVVGALPENTATEIIDYLLGE
ncbi:MAG: hypothetical protein CVV21_07235 [Candidatus Goldiibacteriota bacterium HGW-Goldbacteria-1]|jgi:thiol-disulfide isomerase/thioredoxin|nr:MAG: hypothetical protein CVV21_07235 [Candidatus Goldiibacteriota bacterium HGW-Goldbacteria-1]